MCAYREAVKRVREVTFPDSSVTTTSSAQHNLKGDIGDTVMPQTTNLDGGPDQSSAHPVFRFKPDGPQHLLGEETKMFPSGPLSAVATLEACDPPHCPLSYSTYPAISQLPVAEAAQIHESLANGVVFKLRLLSKNVHYYSPDRDRDSPFSKKP